MQSIVSYHVTLFTEKKLTAADDLKDVIQQLFEIQSAVHGYLGPETQQELVRKMYVTIAHLPY